MFPNLQAEMARNGITAADIARVIRKTDKSVKNKMNGVGDFSLTEIVNIRDNLFTGIALDFLFERGDKKEKPA